MLRLLSYVSLLPNSKPKATTLRLYWKTLSCSMVSLKAFPRKTPKADSKHLQLARAGWEQFRSIMVLVTYIVEQYRTLAVVVFVTGCLMGFLAAHAREAGEAAGHNFILRNALVLLLCIRRYTFRLLDHGEFPCQGRYRKGFCCL